MGKFKGVHSFTATHFFPDFRIQSQIFNEFNFHKFFLNFVKKIVKPKNISEPTQALNKLLYYYYRQAGHL